MQRTVWMASVALACLLLGACSSDSPTAGSTSASPTVTATVPRLMPSQVPNGWQIFDGPHFAIAYPPNWTVSSNTEANSTPQRPDVVWRFSSADSTQSLAVNEQDGWDAQSIQQDFCSQQGTPVTLAGLQWRYSTAEGGVLKSWLFVTAKGTVYGLTTVDGARPEAVQQQNAAVLATFHAEYTTPGCK